MLVLCLVWPLVDVFVPSDDVSVGGPEGADDVDEFGEFGIGGVVFLAVFIGCA